MIFKRRTRLWVKEPSSTNCNGKVRLWTKIFRYTVGEFDLWEYISFTFCYAGFLWFATDEDLAWFKYYSEKHNGVRKGLEWAYKRIIEMDKHSKDYIQEERDAYNKGYDAPLKKYPNLYRDKDKFIREYWEENRRWEHYGLTPEEMEAKRKLSSNDDRKKRMNQPIVYEKAIDENETLVVRDKIDGKYTVYIVQFGSVNLDTVKYKTTEHIYECPSFDEKRR